MTSTESSTGSRARYYLSVFAVTLTAYLVSVCLLPPKTTVFEAPVHTDIYQYFVVSKLWLSAIPGYHSILYAPRPLSIVFLRLLAVVDNFALFQFLLGLLSVALVIQVLRFANRLFVTTHTLLSVAVFSLACFISPHFYVWHIWDFCGILSGIFFFQGLILLDDHRPSPGNLAYAVFLILSVLTKPTYTIAAIITPLCFYIWKRDKKHIFAFCSATVIVAGILAWDAFILKSQFIQFNGVHPWVVSFNPMTNIRQLLMFVPEAIIPIPCVLIFGGVAFSWMRQYYPQQLLLAALAIASLAPMAFIPNRFLPMYAWYGTLPLLVPILPLFSKHLKEELSPGRAIMFIALFASAVAAVKLVGDASERINHQQYHRNVLTSVKDSINEFRVGETVFVTGVEAQVSPFVTKRFAQIYFGKKINWVLLDSPEAWAEAYPFISGKDLPPMTNKVDRLARFDKEGFLYKLETLSAGLNGSRLSEEEKRAFICPEHFGPSVPNPDPIQRIGCLIDRGVPGLAIALLHNTNDLVLANQWYWYWGGRAYAGVKDWPNAVRFFEKAEEIDHGDFFLNALSGARKEKDAGERR
jgi:hypothetical protein